MDQLRLTSDLDIGNSLSHYQESSILYELEWRIQAEVNWQNQLHSLHTASAKGIEMRDVKNTAVNLRDLVNSIKKATLEAQAAFAPEAKMAIDNANKLRAAAADLKEANQMVEEVLGETGSNFPSAGSDHHLEPPDINGVSVNKPNAPAGGADANGVTLNKGS